MPLKLFNTLTGKKDAFTPPPPGAVRMYHCGPTVYDFAHIGNLRAYVFADVLRRTFEYLGYGVTQVINITDIGHLTSDADEGDDKMVRALKREGLPLSLRSLKIVADTYTAAFVNDLNTLNCKFILNGEQKKYMPRASEHVQEDIELIQSLESRGAAYQTADGVYFDTAKFPSYGKLGNVNREGQKEGARVGVNPEKRNAADFTLWKFSRGDIGWESPWGLGFPGWHIECSAMSEKYLSPLPFDIHTGGIEHIPIHHQNEIAQTETARGKELARYWLHVAHVTKKGGKMAKSEGNSVTLSSLKNLGIHPLAYRLWLLGTHYRMTASFDEEAVRAAQNAHDTLIRAVAAFPPANDARRVSLSTRHQSLFQAALEDDINTPKALAVLWEVTRDPSLSPEQKRETIRSFERVLGLNLFEEAGKLSEVRMPPEALALQKERDKARAEKDFVTADTLRKEIEKLGFAVEDGETGSTLRPLRTR